jgi:hypothetical protein
MQVAVYRIKFHWVQNKKCRVQAARRTKARWSIFLFVGYISTIVLLTVFSATNEPDTIGNFVEGEKYWVKAIAEKAQGRSDMEMKE